ncbi:Holliday junction branch migration protein RuvA [Patescibacteria group bacterium]|nr:Holliday junction branch migration protein RuvA [Patescibacteria group bacterium]
MIAYLEGKVKEVASDWLVLQTGGVGYKILTVGCTANVGDQISLDIFDYVREDRRELYGFTDRAVYDLFTKVIEVPGVGTKLAQKILNSVSQEELMKHLLSGDVGLLTSIPGVGKKTAQKLILELKGVLVTEEDFMEDVETLEALMSLGYSRKDCARVLRQVGGETVEEKLKEALQMLGASHGS